MTLGHFRGCAESAVIEIVLHHKRKSYLFRFPFVQKIPVRELRASDKTDIVELAVVMQAGKCPFIVEFFGCLIRDVSELVED